MDFLPRVLKSLVMTSLWAATAALGQTVYIDYAVTTVVDGHDANPGDGNCQATGGGCTLRAAIEENEAAAGWGQVALPEGYYTLTLGPLTITSDLTIKGEDAGSTIIDANGQQGMNINGGSTGTNVWLYELTIKKGYATNSLGSGKGGGIYVGSDHTNVLLHRVYLVDNESDWKGGAIYSAQGWVTLSECWVTSNSAPRSDGSGEEGSGGGIWNSGNMEIRRSTISYNEGTQGGGIFNVNRLKLINSTVSHNVVTWRGAGLANPGLSSNMVVAFSTITENETGVDPGEGRTAPQFGSHPGGGIYNVGTLNIGTSIVAGNLVSDYDWTDEYSPDCWSKDHQVTDFMADGTPYQRQVHPVWTSFRNNILGVLEADVCNAVDGTLGAPPLDQFGTELSPLDPLTVLGPSLQHGGAIPTYSLPAGSPALNRSNGYPGLADFECPETDQRGVPRPPANTDAGSLCDVGAFEQSATTGPMEAEDAEFSGAFVKSSHADASGGWYTSTANVLPGDSNGDQMNGPDEGHKLRFTFYVDKDAIYTVKAWAHALPPDDNSFYVRIDNKEAVIWDLAASGTGFAEYYVSSRGQGDEQNPEEPRYTEYLNRGMHTLEINQRETGTWLDKVQIVEETTAQMNVETEASAMRFGAFMLGTDAAAFAGGYITTPPSFEVTGSVPDPDHRAVFNLEAPQAGTYLLRANVHAEWDDHNSFWVKVDGGQAYLWDMTETNSRYGLDYLSHRGNGDSRDPELAVVEFSLTAGYHTVEVFAREGGTRLDRIGLELKSDAEARIISRNKPMYSSSNQGSSFGPEKAVDNNTSTRWSSQASDNQWIKVDLGATYDVHRVSLSWEAAYGRDYELQISNDAENWTTLYHKEEGNGGIDDWTVMGRGRYVRMLGLARGTQWGYSLYEFTVYGVPAVGGTLNLAAGKTAFASSQQSSQVAASLAFDQNMSTRWSSNFADGEWIFVDLGSAKDINRVKLSWEAAYGRGYDILVSDDASNWTVLFSTTSGNGGTDDLSVSGRGRYVKMKGRQRGTAWGYSLYEFAVYGK